MLRTYIMKLRQAGWSFSGIALHSDQFTHGRKYPKVVVKVV